MSHKSVLPKQFRHTQVGLIILHLMRINSRGVHGSQIFPLLTQSRQTIRHIKRAGIIEIHKFELGVRIIQQAANEDILGDVGDELPGLRFDEDPDQVPRQGVELPAGGAEVAVTVLEAEAAGDEGSVLISSGGVPIDARSQELVVETLGVNEAVIVDLGDELP